MQDKIAASFSVSYFGESSTSLKQKILKEESWIRMSKMLSSCRKGGVIMLCAAVVGKSCTM